MTKNLHDVLSDIASDAGPVDLLDRVRGETRALRWRRRATVGAVGLGAAGAIVLGAVLVSPTVESPTDPAETAAPVSPLPAEIDLTAAAPGGVAAASLVIVSEGVLYAVDAATDDVVRIETEQLVLGRLQLSADGSRVLVQYDAVPGEVLAPFYVIDLNAGTTVFAGRQKSTSDRFELSPDGDRLAATQYETDSLGNARGQPEIELIDLASGATTRVEYTPVPTRDGALLVNDLAWSPDGSRLALQYFNGQDIFEIPSGALVAAETLTSLLLIANPWSADSSRLLKQSGSAVSTWPTNGPGRPIGSSRIVGQPLGFAGPDLLLWLVDSRELVVTTLDGDAVGVPTRIVTDTSVDDVTSALATAAG